jgi:isoquinoline 1-oxidoreductase subunit beta
MNTTARYTADKCEVWVPTQDGEASFAAVLAASGLPAGQERAFRRSPGALRSRSHPLTAIRHFG